MSDVSPEQDWFEKADQDLEMARRALGQKNLSRGWPATTPSSAPRNI